jgi:hypothetical protein
MEHARAYVARSMRSLLGLDWRARGGNGNGKEYTRRAVEQPDPNAVICSSSSHRSTRVDIGASPPFQHAVVYWCVRFHGINDRSPREGSQAAGDVAMRVSYLTTRKENKRNYSYHVGPSPPRALSFSSLICIA